MGSKKKKAWRKKDVEAPFADKRGEQMDFGDDDGWSTGPINAEDSDFGLTEESIAEMKASANLPKAPPQTLPPMVPPTVDVEKAWKEEETVIESQPNANIKKKPVINVYEKVDNPYLWKTRKLEKNTQKKAPSKKMTAKQKQKKHKASERGMNNQLRLITKTEKTQSKKTTKEIMKGVW